MEATVSGRSTASSFLDAPSDQAQARNATSDLQNFLLTPNPNQHYSDLVPLLRGALRNVTDAERDAVDAAARLTGEPDADGKIVWSWRPDAGAKVAGLFRERRGKRARSPGRART
jgi:hypothetical protein